MTVMISGGTTLPWHTEIHSQVLSVLWSFMSLEKREAESSSPNTPMMTNADLKYLVCSWHHFLVLGWTEWRQHQHVGQSDSAFPHRLLHPATWFLWRGRSLAVMFPWSAVERSKVPDRLSPTGEWDNCAFFHLSAHVVAAVIICIFAFWLLTGGPVGCSNTNNTCQ